MRLSAHLDSRVKVPDLADTARPVTEVTAPGAISLGGEQLEVNDQSVTPSFSEDTVNSIRSAWLATCGDDCGACCKSDEAAPVKDWARHSNAACGDDPLSDGR